MEFDFGSLFTHPHWPAEIRMLLCWQSCYTKHILTGPFHQENITIQDKVNKFIYTQQTAEWRAFVHIFGSSGQDFTTSISEIPKISGEVAQLL